MRICRSQLLHSLLAGRTVIGERVWDIQRLIDWAVSQPDIDGSGILVMGNSGGGMVTMYAAACDERISVSVASCSFCTFVGRNGAIHHCDCNAVPGVMRFGEFHVVVGLSLSGLRRIYASAEASSAVEHAWGLRSMLRRRTLINRWIIGLRKSGMSPNNDGCLSMPTFNGLIFRKKNF